MSISKNSAAAGAEQIQATIKNLEDQLRAAQELLFLVLDDVGEPVVIDATEARKKSLKDRAIDLDLDEKAGTWTLKVVNING